MSGLKSIGQLYGFVNGGAQVSQQDIDQYQQYIVWAPSVDTSYIGTVTSSTANAALVFKNKYPDYPRNTSYSVTGGASGQGGTFTLAGQDQFGGSVIERVVIGSANGGGTTQGTAIFAKYGAGSYSPNGAAGSIGTAAIGFGTAPGTAGTAGNYFGLPTKLGGTADVKSLTWISTNTPTTLAGGTAFGTLVNTTTHSFTGTAGIANTDRYVVMIKSSFDNSAFGTMSAL